MATYECGETYVHRLRIRDRDGVLTYPSTVEFDLWDNCGGALVTGGSMATDATGTYEYKYAIPSTCQYGEYTVQVKATDAAGDVQIFSDTFYVLPWDISLKVRRHSGITSKKTLSDNDLDGIIWEAYQEALDELYEYRHNDIPKCDPDSGEWINGTNTTFETPYSPIADKNGDGVVTGWGQVSCGTDIEAWWRDVDGDCHRANVTVNEAHCGNITITQLDGTPLPSDLEWVRLDYHIEYKTYDERLFRLAVAYLSAHKVIGLRLKELDRATAADLHSNEKRILLDMDRMEKAYKKVMRRIKKPVIGAGMLPGE